MRRNATARPALRRNATVRPALRAGARHPAAEWYCPARPAGRRPPSCGGMVLSGRPAGRHPPSCGGNALSGPPCGPASAAHAAEKRMRKSKSKIKKGGTSHAYETHGRRGPSGGRPHPQRGPVSRRRRRHRTKSSRPTPTTRNSGCSAACCCPPACSCAEAVESYSKAIAIDPFNGILYRHRGHRHISCREYEQAAADFVVASRLIPRTGTCGTIWACRTT